MKKSFSMMSRDVLPVSILLFVLLILVTGFSAQTGLHLQDGMYEVGVDDPEIAQLLAGDASFSVYLLDAPLLNANRNSFDLIIIQGTVSSSDTDKANAAQKTLERDYAKYVNSIYNTEEDLFAAYPLWIDTQSVKSELTFLATQSNIPGTTWCNFSPSETNLDERKPELLLEYSNTLTTTHGTGGLGWGGWNIPTIEQTISPSGGFAIGGGALTVKPITWDTSNAVSLISKVANPISYSSSSTYIDIANAIVDYKRPFKYWRSLNDDSDVTITAAWDIDIDTIIIYNCNIDSITITALSDQAFTTVRDNNTGMYHLVARIDTNSAEGYTAGIKKVTITIPAQTPNDGLGYFKIGSILAGNRTIFSEAPQLPIKKEFIEPVITKGVLWRE